MQGKGGKTPTKTKPVVKWQCHWKTSVQPPPRGSLTCAGQHLLLPGAGQWPRAALGRFPGKGNGTGVGNRSLCASSKGGLTSQESSCHLTSPLSPKLHVGRSISHHCNTEKYLWMFSIPSGISGAASCWEESNYTCDSHTARVQPHQGTLKSKQVFCLLKHL